MFLTVPEAAAILAVSADTVREWAREGMKRQTAAAITLADATKRVSGNQLEQARKMRAESQPELIESERAANARLTEELDATRAALDDVSAAIGTNEFMDPPDGGSPSLAEQVRRMRTALAEAQKDAARYRWLVNAPSENSPIARMNAVYRQWNGEDGADGFTRALDFQRIDMTDKEFDALPKAP